MNSRRRYRYLSVTALTIIFAVSFLLTTGLTAAASGVLSIFAKDNSVTIIADTTVNQQLDLTISSSQASGFTNSINSPLKVDIRKNVSTYTDAGTLYIKNASTFGGDIDPVLRVTSGQDYAPYVNLHVYDEAGTLVYNGPLDRYGNYAKMEAGKTELNYGRVKVNPNQTKGLKYQVVFNTYYSPPAGKAADWTKNQPIKFDLEFKTAGQ